MQAMKQYKGGEVGFGPSLDGAYRAMGCEVLIPVPKKLWKASDPLPRLALAAIVDAYTVMTWTRTLETEENDIERQRARRETLLWLDEKETRPFSLSWCIQVLNMAGVEISAEKVREGCLLAYSGARQKAAGMNYGTLTLSQIGRTRPKRPGHGRKRGLHSLSSSQEPSTPT